MNTETATDETTLKATTMEDIKTVRRLLKTDAVAEIIRERDKARGQRDRLAGALRQYAWPCSDAELAHHCASASPSFSVEAQRVMKRRKALQSLTTNAQ